MTRRPRAMHSGPSLARILLYELGRLLVVLPVTRLFYRLRSVGRENVPRSGPVLLVANHQSHLDPPLIGVPIRQLDYVARVGLFQSRFFRWLISALNATPIHEDRGDTRAIKDVLARLEAGRAVVIFPEGSRTPDGTVHPFKRGIWLLVKRAACPVVPVAIEGAFDAWPRTRRYPRLLGCRMAVAYGPPIPHDELLRLGPDAALERLRRDIDGMRLSLRSRLRQISRGRYPAPGPGDAPSPAPEQRGDPLLDRRVAREE